MLFKRKFGRVPDIAKIRSTIAALCNKTLVAPMERLSPCCLAKALARLTEERDALKAKERAALLRDWQCVSPVNCFASRKNLCKALHKFFKWIKQHLHIKSFWGNTESAVRLQIYSAISAYCLVAIVEHDYRLNRNTFDVLRILSASLLDKTLIRELFKKVPIFDPEICDESITQLIFNFCGH